MRSHHWARVRLILNVYIAVAITILAVGVWENLGENEEQNKQNEEQNKQLVLQAKALSISNTKAAFQGCVRGNRLRAHINVISETLVKLLRKSVESNPQPLTAEQRTFLRYIYKQLRPVNPVPCRLRYPLAGDTAPSSP